MEALAIAAQIKQQFGDAVLDISEFRDEVTVLVEPKRIVDVAKYCRDTAGLEFNYLASLSGVDYYPEEARFGVNYVLISLHLKHRIRLKVRVDEGESLPSMFAVYQGANWPEREVFDMFGVKFEGHPYMERILMPYDWTGHPLRKDYPLGYEEVQFSFSYDRVQGQKPNPKE